MKVRLTFGGKHAASVACPMVSAVFLSCPLDLSFSIAKTKEGATDSGNDLPLDPIINKESLLEKAAPKVEQGPKKNEKLTAKEPSQKPEQEGRTGKERACTNDQNEKLTAKEPSQKPEQEGRTGKEGACTNDELRRRLVTNRDNVKAELEKHRSDLEKKNMLLDSAQAAYDELQKRVVENSKLMNTLQLQVTQTHMKDSKDRDDRETKKNNLRVLKRDRDDLLEKIRSAESSEKYCNHHIRVVDDFLRDREKIRRVLATNVWNMVVEDPPEDLCEVSIDGVQQ